MVTLYNVVYVYGNILLIDDHRRKGDDASKSASVKADYHSVQFGERVKFCDSYLVESAISDEIRST